MEEINVIMDLAAKFRDAIESMEEVEFSKSSWFSNFPRGCCGDTSELLSKYFQQNGIKAKYVWGMYGRQSHAWLEYNGYIIDITAEQFSGVNQKVIVTKNKEWYSRFKGQKNHYHDFEIDNDFNKYRLGELYKNIVSHIKKRE